jgi:hypothetical protein
MEIFKHLCKFLAYYLLVTKFVNSILIIACDWYEKDCYKTQGSSINQAFFMFMGGVRGITNNLHTILHIGLDGKNIGSSSHPKYGWMHYKRM